MYSYEVKVLFYHTPYYSLIGDDHTAESTTSFHIAWQYLVMSTIRQKLRANDHLFF
jgi:hypothetical protein